MKTLGRLPAADKGFEIIRFDNKKVVGTIVRDQTTNRWIWLVYGAHPSSAATLADAQDAAETTYNRLFK